MGPKEEDGVLIGRWFHSPLRKLINLKDMERKVLEWNAHTSDLFISTLSPGHSGLQYRRSRSLEGLQPEPDSPSVCLTQGDCTVQQKTSSTGNNMAYVQGDSYMHSVHTSYTNNMNITWKTASQLRSWMMRLNTHQRLLMSTRLASGSSIRAVTERFMRALHAQKNGSRDETCPWSPPRPGSDPQHPSPCLCQAAAALCKSTPPPRLEPGRSLHSPSQANAGIPSF